MACLSLLLMFSFNIFKNITSVRQQWQCGQGAVKVTQSVERNGCKGMFGV